MIHLDLDGLVADFLLGWCRFYKISDPYEDINLHGIWNFPSKIGPETWQQDLSYDFYANLPKTKEADQIIDLVKKFGKYKFLTATIHDECTRGKIDWVAKHYPGIEINCCTDKHLYAEDGHILIDDADHNVEAWIETGEHAILIPRKWNSLHKWHDACIVEFLKHSLELTCLSSRK